MIAEKPKISIITINYNNCIGLQQTIASVIAQTYTNIDYIVIDGGSTDGSVEIIEQHKENISYSLTETDSGIYNAMNKGIAASKGDYLLFLNSGDKLIDKDIIQKAVHKGLTADLVYGDLLFFTDENEWTWNQPATLTFQTFFTSTIPHPSTFIKKSLFDLIGLYDENLKIVADWKFFILAVAKFNCSYRHIDLLIAAYNFNGLSSKPENLEAIYEERLNVLKEFFPRFIKDYKHLQDLQLEAKKISYFLKTRKFIKKIFNQH